MTRAIKHIAAAPSTGSSNIVLHALCEDSTVWSLEKRPGYVEWKKLPPIPGEPAPLPPILPGELQPPVVKKKAQAPEPTWLSLVQHLSPDWPDASEIARAYLEKPTGGILRALSLIEDYDDEEHDYTYTLAQDILEWENS